MDGYNSVLQAGDTKDGLKFNMSNKSARTSKNQSGYTKKMDLDSQAERSHTEQQQQQQLKHCQSKKWMSCLHICAVSPVSTAWGGVMSLMLVVVQSDCTLRLERRTGINSRLALINPNKFTVRVGRGAPTLPSSNDRNPYHWTAPLKEAGEVDFNSLSAVTTHDIEACEVSYTGKKNKTSAQSGSICSPIIKTSQVKLFFLV